jgi:AmmeMemoRadiSam system protein A
MSSADLAPPAAPSLRRLALDSIAWGLRHGCPPTVDLSEQPPEWCEPGACFVTLRIDGNLRGCTGSLQATRPLAEDVVHNAYRTAFGDPRFPPVSVEELPRLEVKVAVLSTPEPFPVESEADLLARLRPGVDGLVLLDGPHRATFLPAVWESLPDPADFVGALRQKAGLPPGYWSPTLRFERYTTEDVA